MRAANTTGDRSLWFSDDAGSRRDNRRGSSSVRGCRWNAGRCGRRQRHSASAARRSHEIRCWLSPACHPRRISRLRQKLHPQWTGQNRKFTVKFFLKPRLKTGHWSSLLYAIAGSDCDRFKDRAIMPFTIWKWLTVHLSGHRSSILRDPLLRGIGPLYYGTSAYWPVFSCSVVRRDPLMPIIDYSVQLKENRNKIRSHLW